MAMRGGKCYFDETVICDSLHVIFAWRKGARRIITCP